MDRVYIGKGQDAESIIQAGDERSKEEIVEELGERAKRDQANYLKAVKKGFVVTDEEIEEGIVLVMLQKLSNIIRYKIIM